MKNNVSPWKISKIKGSDPGIRLRVGQYIHEQSNEADIDQVIFFFTGRGEWIEKYNSLPKMLKIKKNQKLIIWDHRGQGGSEGTRSYVRHYSEFVADAKIIIQRFSKSKSFYTVSHSMGGLISLTGYVQGHWRPQAIIMSSPLLLLPNKPIDRKLIRPIVAIANIIGKGTQHVKPPHSSVDLFADNDLTHDVNSFKTRNEQPYTYTPPTLAWVNATFNAIGYINKKSTLKKIQIPIFIMGGSLEKVVDPKGWSNWAQKAQRYSNAEVDFHIIHGARHELFNEIKKYKTQALKLYETFVRKIKLEQSS